MAPRRTPSHEPSRRSPDERSLRDAVGVAVAAAAAMLAPASCAHDWDSYDPRLGGGGNATTSTGGATAGTGGSATTTSTGGAMTTSSTGGAGGSTTSTGGATTTSSTGGSGGAGGGGICEPNVAMPCYTGPDGTQGKGVCKGGSAICEPDGASYGPCLGEVTPVVESCALPADEDCNGLADDHCGLWAAQFGASGEQRANAIAVDAAGNILVAGRLAGTMPFGAGTLASAGGLDAFVVKLDANGQPVWGRVYGDAAAQEALGVAVDGAGNVLVTGYFHGTVDFSGGAGPAHTSQGLADAFVVKLSPGGDHLWSKTAGGALDQYGVAVAADGLGNAIVGGSFDGATDFGVASPASFAALDGFVWKLDAAGAPNWVKTFGESGDDETLAVAVGPSNHVFATGYYDEEVDFGAGPIGDGGGSDVFLVEIDPAGSYVFGKGYQALDDQYGRSISLDAAGDIFLSGGAQTEVSFGGPPLPIQGLPEDVFAVKLDPSGAEIWLRVFGDAESQSIGGSAVDGAGDLVLTFSNDGTVDLGGGPLVGAAVGDSDVVVAKLHGDTGDHVWGRIFGDTSDQDARAITVDSMNDILVTGEFAATIDFGTGALDNVSGDDVFVAKLPP